MATGSVVSDLTSILRSLIKTCQSVNILVTGKTGVGKSSLVNAIVGKDVAQEGKNLGGVTRDVSCHEAVVNDVKFEIWDSPGLQDITEEDDTVTKRIQHTLRQKCSHLHLLLYCIRMDRDRIEKSELEAIKLLSEVFKPKIWETAVFALTFANRVLPPSEMECDKEIAQWFTGRIIEFQEMIVRALVESGVRQDNANNIPVIPTGYHKRTKQMPNPRELYDRPDWFNPFWLSCAHQMEENAVVLLMGSQEHRIKVGTEELIEKQKELERREEQTRMQQYELDRRLVRERRERKRWEHAERKREKERRERKERERERERKKQEKWERENEREEREREKELGRQHREQC